MDVASLVVGIAGVLVSVGAWIWAARADRTARRIESVLQHAAEPVSWSLELVSRTGSSSTVRVTNDGPGTARGVVIKPTGLEMNLVGTKAAQELLPGQYLEFVDEPLSDSAGREVEVSWLDPIGVKSSESHTLPVNRAYL